MFKKIEYKSGRRVITKAAPMPEVLVKLRSFLDAAEPGLVYWLVNLWKNQGRAVTYKALREAILSGDVPADWFEHWFQDYTEFVSERMRPAWEKAIMEAAKVREEKYPDWYFNPAADGVLEWTDKHSAEFVTSVTQTQVEGIRAVVRRAATMEGFNVDLLARAIRPMVGLYYQQSVANLNYYNSLIQGGMKELKALDLSVRYAARQSRYRGYLIARQELAMAYNTGADQAVRQAQELGYMGDMVKVVSTADDERVCEICGPMEGVIVGMDEEFSPPYRGNYKFTSLYPPFHISCRCAVEYREISPPVIK